MQERVLGYSNKGKVKPNNEDCFVIDNETYLGDNEVSKNKANLCAVLDGIGGENFGELASKFGAEFVAENFKEFLVHDKNSISELLDKCSNYIIKNLSNLKESRFSGTTIAGFMFNKDDKDVVTIFNVGDSRVYYVGQKYIEQISYDDSMVNYLIKMGLISKADKDKVPVNKNIIFNALGNSHFKVQESHVFSFNMKMSQKKIDYIFCCTDGVTDNISDKELFRLFTHRHPKSLSEIKDRIVNAVEKEGSPDNYSFVILDLIK